jgi:hypothetical protein
MVTSSCWRKIAVRGLSNAIRSAQYGKTTKPTKTEKISRKAEFRRRPTSPYYGGQVAPSPPLASSAKDAKSQRFGGSDIEMAANDRKKERN